MEIEIVLFPNGCHWGYLGRLNKNHASNHHVYSYEKRNNILKQV